MTLAAIKIKGFSAEELASYIRAQIQLVVPDEKVSNDRHLIDRHLEQALTRLAVCSRKVMQWHPDEFDPLLSSQHSSFLYLLSNTIWKEERDESTPTKLFLLNKALHGIELFYKIELPPIFMIGHTVGIVLSNTVYGNYFAIFQNSTVGRYGEERPIIGAGVLMFPNTSIIGRCRVGDRTVISQGTSLINQDSPGNVRVFGSGKKNVILKPGSSGILEKYFRDIEI